MLTEKQKLAVDMLYNDMRICDIALACGVHRVTIWRWTQKKEFLRELRRRDSELNRRYARIRKTARQRQRRKEQRQEKLINRLGEKIKAEAEKAGPRGKPSPAFYKACHELESVIDSLWK